MGIRFSISQLQAADGGTSIAIAVLLLVAVAIGFALGYALNRGVAAKATRLLQLDNDQLRMEKDQAVMMRTQALNERERALGDSQARQQEYSLLETQFRSAQRQATQATSAWKSCEEQVQELEKATEAFRGQAEDLRLKLVESERTASERLLAIDRLTNQLRDLRDRYGEVEKLAMDRQAALTSSNNQLSRLRATMSETDFAITEVQMMLQAMMLRVDTLRDRVVNLDVTPYVPLPPMPPGLGSSLPAPASAPKAQAEPKPAPELPTDEEPNVGDEGDEGVTVEAFVEHRMPTLAPPPTLTPPMMVAAAASAVESPAPTAPSPAAAPSNDTGPKIEEQLEQMTRRLDELHRALSRVPPASGSPETSAHGSAAAEEEAWPSGAPSFLTAASDDLAHLQDIRGIGLVYAMRLNRAGVRTLEDLAGATPEKLDSIINAPKWRRPDYEDWIGQAVKLVKGQTSSPQPPQA